MKLYFQGDWEQFRFGLAELTQQLDYVPLFDSAETDGIRVTIEKGEKLGVMLHEKNAVLRYKQRVHVFRGLGLLIGALREGNTDYEIEEEMYFTMNGPMFDVSQGNAVINISSVKELIRNIAVMGMNMLMLYCQDSFQVPEEPYFGYMRGKYTAEDMREMDDYAYGFGIEIIPCMQTLAHQPNLLRWKVYDSVKEDEECLLVGEEKTYELIRHELAAASTPFRSRRIHIGMDEAWKLGRGTYLDRNGFHPKWEIMREHLAKVWDIVQEMGLKPMMWSDMFFRTANPREDYYVNGLTIPQEIVNSVPKGMQLVYWDYYHQDTGFYEDYIRIHRQFGDTVFAGGIWNWMGYGLNWFKTFDTSYPALIACKKSGIREVIATVWSDNGTESNVFASLPGLQFFAEHGYREDPSLSEISKRFETCTGLNWDDFMLLSHLDKIPSLPLHMTPPPGQRTTEWNCSKFLLWQDVLTGLFDQNIEGLPLTEHYAKLYNRFDLAVKGERDRYGIMEISRDLCDVLTIKAELGLRLTKAYRNKDTAALLKLAEQTIPELIERVARLRKHHKTVWKQTYQPFGWDIQDLHYGGLVMRLKSAAEQITAYLEGDLTALKELEEPRLPYNGIKGLPSYTNQYGEIASPSKISRWE